MTSRGFEGFLHLILDSDSNYVDLEESFASGFNNNGDCEEIRLSVTKRAFQSSRNIINDEGEDPGRILEFIRFIKTLMRTEPHIEKITFDSGFSNNSKTIPLDAVGEALSHARALKRLDLSYVQVTCEDESQIQAWQEKLQSSQAKSRLTLEQCCLDRCSVSVIASNNDHLDVGLDSLMSLFVRAFPRLEWFTICSDTFTSLRNETLIDMCRTPSLKELMLWNFDLDGDQHLLCFFESLLEHRSPLIRLTLPTTLTTNGARAVARYLQQQSVPTQLLGLTLTVNQFLHNGEVTHDDTVIQDILSILANALQVNQTLQSFRMRGSAKIQRKKVFASMLEHNYTLQYFSILNDNASDGGSDEESEKDTANIQMYLKLNRNGRRDLLSPLTGPASSNHHQWVEAIATLRHDLNCLFYLLQTNPSLCCRKK